MTTHRNSASAAGHASKRLVAAGLTALLLGGCAENNDMFKTLNWFGPPPGGVAGNESLVTLPDTPATLGNTPVEKRLHTAVALAAARSCLRPARKSASPPNISGTQPRTPKLRPATFVSSAIGMTTT